MRPYPLTFNLDGEEFREGYDCTDAEGAKALAKLRLEVHVQQRRPKLAYVTVWNDPEALDPLGAWDYDAARDVPKLIWTPEGE